MPATIAAQPTTSTASPARIAANRANALKSTGPSSPEGKAISRRNSLKHGLTGAGVVQPEEDAAEVERLAGAMQDELKPPGEVGALLVRQVAMMSVRMERSFQQENAALTERVRRVRDEFQPPEGVDAETAEKFRDEACKIAMFDPSREACLARMYEAAARRGFFKALDELRKLTRAANAVESTPAPGAAVAVAAQAQATMAQLGSFFQAEVKVPAKPATTPSKPLPAVSKPLPGDWDPFGPTHFDVPIAIGKRR
jgi:hypothetical protein